MSLLSIGAVGIYRDLAPYAKRISGKAAIAPAAPHPGPATASSSGDSAGSRDAGSVASFGQLLVAQIPSEALLAYTTLLALFSAGTDGYQPGRWVLYGVSLPACAAVVIGSYLAKRDYTFEDPPADGAAAGPAGPAGPGGPADTAAADTAAAGLAGPAGSGGARAPRRALGHLPWLPTAAAVLAMAVYGLTVPGSALQGAMSATGFAITSGCLAVGGGLMMSIFAPFLARGNGAKAKPAPPPAPSPAPAPVTAGTHAAEVHA
jgi:hypothetical protein